MGWSESLFLWGVEMLYDIDKIDVVFGFDGAADAEAGFGVTGVERSFFVGVAFEPAVKNGGGGVVDAGALLEVFAEGAVPASDFAGDFVPLFAV